MNSLINPSVFSDTFSFPGGAVDNHIKLASASQLKVLLYLFRHSSEELGEEVIAEALSLSLTDVKDAVGYWAGAGFLVKENKSQKVNSSDTKKARMQSAKPTREEIARMGANDEKLQFLLREAQNRFSRPLRQAETSLLAWLYSDEGMDVAVILMLLEFATRENKVNVRFIENTAIEWLNSGVETISDAEKKLEEALIFDQCWKLVSASFGIQGRKPSKKEKELSVLWVNQWKYDRKILEKAYEICVDSISEFSIPYIKTILEKWHKSGVKTVEDIKDEPLKKEKPKKNSYAAYEDANKLFNTED